MDIRTILSCCVTMSLSMHAMGQDAGGAAPQPAAQPAAPMVLIKTSLGDIKVKLFADKAPITVSNFLAYADSGFYNGTIFHRVIDNFMVQGGGLTRSMEEKDGRPAIKNEATNGLKNKRGTLAMARTSDVDSATSQFFINVVDNGFLDNKGTQPMAFGYCVFGEVVSGMDVVDQIRKTKTTRVGGMPDVPAEPIEMITVERIAE